MSGHSFGAGYASDIQNQKIQANLKASMTAVRPIAPTPNVTQIRQPLQVSATQLLGGPGGQTSISTKIATGVNYIVAKTIDVFEAIGLGATSTQPAAGDHSAQLTAVNLANLTPGVSQSSSGTQIRTLNTQQPLLQLHSQQQAATGLTQQNVVRLQNSVQVAAMSSIIKGGVQVPTLVQGQQTGSQVHAQVGSHPTHQMPQVFPAAHLPRGAAAASQLTATKASGVATAMLRPNQLGTAALQIPASATAGGSTTIVPTGVPQQHIQPRALLTGVRGHTPPITRAESPVVQMHHAHGDGHKTVASLQTSVPSIQIQKNRVEVQTRPVPQIQQTKNATVAQQPIAQVGGNQTQKLVVSQGSAGVTPMLQTSVGIHTPLPGQKIGGQLMSPMLRHQKISQPSNLAGHSATGYALNNTRSKIIVTQAAPQHNLHGGTIISTIAKTSALGPTSVPRQQQQKVMSQSLNTMATTMTVTSLPTKGAKITPQRQTSLGPHHNIAHLQQQQTHHSISHPQVSTQPQLEPQALRVSSTTHQSSQHQSLVQQAVAAASGNPNAASVFLSQKPGGATSVVVPSPALSQASTGEAVNRESSQERVLQQLQYNIPSNVAAQVQAYYNTGIGTSMGMSLYQHPQALAANRSLQKGQAPGGTATLQSTSHGGAVGTQAHPTGTGPVPVRINNPLMVTVDPSSRHPATTNQQNAQHISSAELIANKSGQATQNFKYAVNKTDSSLVATMASSHLNAAMGATHVTHQPASQNTVPSSSNLTSSPRPSILRKRNSEAITVVKRQILGGPSLPTPSPSSSTTQSDNSSTDHHHSGPIHLQQSHHLQQLHTGSSSTTHQQHPAASMSPKSTVLDVCNENSQSSTDTASSTQSTPQSKLYPHSVKADHQEAIENGHLGGALSNSNEASPRKKPRKQLLTHVNSEDIKDSLCDSGDLDPDEQIEKFSQRVQCVRQMDREQEEEEEEEEPQAEEVQEYVDDEGIRWVREKKRPPIALLNHYQCSWKPKNNHFLRHTDVKPKEERRPTVNELANQKNVLQKSSGWKMYHLAAQLEELMDIEKVVYDKMVLVQDQVAPKHIAKTTMEDDIGMVHELSQGNIQRCQLFTDQMQEAKTAMLKILDHKKRILEIVTKHHSKRPVKKKERS